MGKTVEATEDPTVATRRTCNAGMPTNPAETTAANPASTSKTERAKITFCLGVKDKRLSISSAVIL